MNINLGFFQFASWKPDPEFPGMGGSGCWFRIFGYGLHFTNAPHTFSERNGFKRIKNVPFTSYRWSVLKKEDFRW